MNTILHYAARTIFRTLEPLVRTPKTSLRYLATSRISLMGQVINARIQLVPLLIAHYKPCQLRYFMLGAAHARRKSKDRDGPKRVCGKCPGKPVTFPICKKRKNCVYARRKHEYRPKTAKKHQCGPPPCPRKSHCQYVNPRQAKEMNDERKRIEREVQAQLKLERCVYNIPQKKNKD